MSLKRKKKCGETDYHGNRSDVVQDGGIISDISQNHSLVSRKSHQALLGNCVQQQRRFSVTSDYYIESEKIRKLHIFCIRRSHKINIRTNTVL